MKHGRIADFFFAGLGITPLALMLGGFPDFAILLFVPLMFVACFFGMTEQLQDAGEPEDVADAGGGSLPRDVPGLALKCRETAGKQK